MLFCILRKSAHFFICKSHHDSLFFCNFLLWSSNLLPYRMTSFGLRRLHCLSPLCKISGPNSYFSAPFQVIESLYWLRSQRFRIVVGASFSHNPILISINEDILIEMIPEIHGNSILLDIIHYIYTNIGAVKIVSK